MQINNLNYNVPSQVRQLLYSQIPFGSEYVLYCSSYSQATQVYDLLFKKVASDNLYHFRVTHSNNDYTLSEITESDSYDGFTVQSPYYCYSSLPQQGIKESLPTTNDLICLMLIVLASLAVLRTVFGGIKLWFSQKKSVV